MNVEKVMEILDQFEVRAIENIKLDKAIDADNYDSVGEFKLIRKIRKRIIAETSIDDDREAA